ncbi:MAG: LysR family transcriptional regulator [Burkholderiaceae bacterium]
MDLTLMRSLLAVADEGALTAAADRIGLSQPALTRRMQQLEEYFGCDLFIRSRKGVELSEIGLLVANEARVLVNRFDTLRQQVQAHLNLDAGIVRIGGGATAVSFLLPKAIAGFQTAHPEIRFHLKEAGSREIANDVASGQLELGVVTLPIQSAELSVSRLMIDRVVLVARNDHPLVSNQPIQNPTQALSDQAYVGFEAGSAIRGIIDAALRTNGIQMNVVMELRSIPAILRMVATTGYLAFVSQASLEGQAEVAEIGVRGLTIERELGIVARRDIPLSPAAGKFAQTLRSLNPVAADESGEPWERDAIR